MKRIAIDMDEVIADTLTTHVEWYNRDYRDELKLSELEGITLLQARPDGKAAIESYYEREDFFRSIKVIEHSQEVLQELSEHFEIYITTAAMEVPASFRAKYEWLLEHFGFLNEMNFVFCGDKSIIRADYMVDDNVKQLRAFKGQGILFTAPRNVNETGFVRVNNWLEARTWFMAQLQKDQQRGGEPKEGRKDA
ncbi:5'-3'-deoxyribonucleotidase [Paenibacillus donghaensis]|uniref:5' nucleotidase, NT5C type n=1 Tax=Paenibacillus donghaensis TaxID=414771 RepID=UPI0018842B52|nr:5'-3'-deoxyribonucleotidase [Paenibacillus donghaensis]MBE9914941.1 5'-3'-deoxyribonucleotidase [Paenibacillus donghaensis]